MVHVSGRVGDSLLGIPAIVAVSENFKKAHIDILVHKNRKMLFENIPGVNSVGVISDKSAKFKGWFAGAIYDLIIVLNYYEPLEHILKYALRTGKRVIAFNAKSQAINKKLYVSLKRNFSQHSTNAYLELLSPLKIKYLNPRIKFYLTEDEMKFPQKIMTDHSLQCKYLVGFQISTLRPYRNWPVSYFVDTFKMIKSVKPNALAIIFGSTDDQKRIAQFKVEIGKDSYLDLSGLSLRLTAAFMSQLNLYLGVDTGPTHLMSTFDIPMVVLYHCTVPSIYYGPLQHPHFTAIDHPLGFKGNEGSSMKDIKPNIVFKEIKRYL